MKRQCQDHGSSPGSPFGDVGNILAPPSVAGGVLVDAHASFVPSQIAAPTVEELSHALALGSSVNFENSGECFRVLFAQINCCYVPKFIALTLILLFLLAIIVALVVRCQHHRCYLHRPILVVTLALWVFLLPKFFNVPYASHSTMKKISIGMWNLGSTNAPLPVLLKAAFVLVFVHSIIPCSSIFKLQMHLWKTVYNC